MKREIKIVKGRQEQWYTVCNCIVMASPKVMMLENGKGFKNSDGSYVIRDNDYLLVRNGNFDGKIIDRMAIQMDAMRPKTNVFVGDSPATEFWPMEKEVNFRRYGE